MKHLHFIATAGFIFIGCLISKAHAADQILNCSIGYKQGIAQIKVLRAEGHPEARIFDLTMKVKSLNPQDQGRVADLYGSLAAQINPSGGVFASGTIMTQPNSDVIINPESISLQGDVETDGTYNLRLYDQNRVLQHGFGTSFTCH